MRNIFVNFIIFFYRVNSEATLSWQRAQRQYVELHYRIGINSLICWSTDCMCVCPGSGAGPGPFGPPAQPPGSVTPSSHQPVMGLAQAQTNNSNNKMGSYAGAATSVSEHSLPEDLPQLMEDWAQELLIVTQRPHSRSLSISRKELWDQAVPHTHRRQTADSEVCHELLRRLHACKT